MKISMPPATLLSQVTIDQDLNMGSYDILLGAQAIKTTDTQLIQKNVGAPILAVRNAADSAYMHLIAAQLWCDGFYMTANGYIRSGAINGYYIAYQSRDDGVGSVEVARQVGAAYAYFQMTRAMRLNPIADPSTLVEGMIWYNATDDKVKIRKASTTEYLELPSGAIIMWHGTIANIPTGFVICDGNAGTPNLLASFVQGVATAATDPGATGGSTAKTTDTKANDQQEGSGGVAVTGAHSHTITDIRPIFYDIAFIMKV